MSPRGTRYRIPDAILRDATDAYARYNADVRAWMIEMGVPESMVGISQFGRDKQEVFSLASAVGGTHSVPIHGQIYTPEILIDVATLDPGFPHMVFHSPTWSRATFHQRVQAVIVHEYEEAMAHYRGRVGNEYPVAISRAIEQIQSGSVEESMAAQQLVHDYGHYGAIRLSLTTTLQNVTEAARRILQEYQDSSPRFTR